MAAGAPSCVADSARYGASRPLHKEGAMVDLDSNSVGDSSRFRALADLEAMLQSLPDGRTDSGSVALLMRRGEGGRREVLEHAVLAPETGIPGDAWGRAPQPRRAMQIAVMQKD